MTKRMSSLVTASSSWKTPSSPPTSTSRRLRHHRPPLAPAGSQSLVPGRWRDAAEEINLKKKKEKRRIAHGLRFGSRLERRPPPAVAAPDEYLAYREGRPDAELVHTARDHVEPLDMPRAPEKVEAPLPPSLGHVWRPGIRGWGLVWATLRTLRSCLAGGSMYQATQRIARAPEDGLPAIHKAILSKKHAIINYHLRNSANPFIHDKDGLTPLGHHARTYELIKLLKSFRLPKQHDSV